MSPVTVNTVTRSGVSILYQTQAPCRPCATTTSLPITHCVPKIQYNVIHRFSCVYNNLILFSKTIIVFDANPFIIITKTVHYFARPRTTFSTMLNTKHTKSHLIIRFELYCNFVNIINFIH